MDGPQRINHRHADFRRVGGELLFKLLLPVDTKHQHVRVPHRNMGSCLAPLS